MLVPDPQSAPAVVSDAQFLPTSGRMGLTPSAPYDSGVRPRGSDTGSAGEEASVVKAAGRIDLKPSSIETGALPGEEQLPSLPRLSFVAQAQSLPARPTAAETAVSAPELLHFVPAPYPKEAEQAWRAQNALR